MKTQNSVYIAQSLDGYIADKNGGIAWLDSVPNPEGDDMGYFDFANRMDALVMGRITFETVCGFDCYWPYTKPVFVLSNTLFEIPEAYHGKAFLVKGTLTEILTQINEKGFSRLYIDGGKTIQHFLKEDLIDEMIITTFPLLLGGGYSLFGDLHETLTFELTSSCICLGSLVQSHFIRKR
ncbi:dihydrofolate reductase family protein [Flectobacillus roseus]|uniref:Dihydrofolate reductase family protein n=1 Tax=Flectobacillus roseus TaxID=502259 RepID=A0ABT6YG04_9BACT|nr:dihydrofolate reductase family protein [Flectobacillus roseus]MDI9862523.1 dihydrofolate reductase family protein [Flectobacillus roseus]